MGTCIDCLFQGDRTADEKGNGRIFCLIKVNWLGEKATCPRFRQNADIGKDVRNRYALDIRQEDAEDRRLKKVARLQFRHVLLTLVVSFALFWATVKFFDKYIF